MKSKNKEDYQKILLNLERKIFEIKSHIHYGLSGEDKAFLELTEELL